MRLMPILPALVLAATALPAQAYVGPGLGLGFLGVLIGLVAAVGLALYAVIGAPVRRMIRGARRGDAGEDGGADAD